MRTELRLRHRHRHLLAVLRGHQDRPQATGIDTGDTVWMLAATALVLMMTIALGLFYAGLVRSKNALNKSVGRTDRRRRSRSGPCPRPRP